jgi:hypothetical protein
VQSTAVLVPAFSHSFQSRFSPIAIFSYRNGAATKGSQRVGRRHFREISSILERPDGPARRLTPAALFRASATVVRYQVYEDVRRNAELELHASAGDSRLG